MWISWISWFSWISIISRTLPRRRRDRDVEMHVVFNAVQVNVVLTTVATVTACPLVLGCIPDFRVFNGNDCVQTVFMSLQPGR